jgi:hypothetical protein
MRTIAILTFPKSNGELIILAHSIVDRMTDNPYFPAPWVPIAKVAAGVAAASAAQAVVLTRAKGTRAARDAVVVALKADLRRLEAYVQSVADDRPEDSLVIVASAGMDAKRRSLRSKPMLEARQGPVSGRAVLIAKWAGDRAMYEWRFSTDQVTWTLAPMTMRARAVISGLVPVTRYYFQLRVTTKDGPGRWSQVVSLVVL